MNWCSRSDNATLEQEKSCFNFLSMITSIAFTDIKGIVINEGELIVITKREGQFEAGKEINFGINAIFGTFEPILAEEIKKIIKTDKHV